MKIGPSTAIVLVIIIININLSSSEGASKKAKIHATIGSGCTKYKINLARIDVKNIELYKVGKRNRFMYQISPRLGELNINLHESLFISLIHVCMFNLTTCKYNYIHNWFIS